MKCPKCGNSLPLMAPGSDGGCSCGRCGCELKEPTYPCQHEPLDLAAAFGPNATITFFGGDAPVPGAVCRHCRVVYVPKE